MKQKITHWYGWALSHKTISAAVLLVLLGGAYYSVRAFGGGAAETRYVLGTVEKGTVISTVSASGQVSAENSIDIKPKVTGDITWVGVAAGQKVRAGQALATIDNTDAVRALKDAQNNLAIDKLNYQKSAAQAPVDYQNDVKALDAAKENLADDYNDAFNDLTDVYLDLPDVVTAAKNTLYGYDFDPKKNQWNMDVLLNLFNYMQDTANAVAFEASAKSDYASANAAYEAAVTAYKTTTRSSDPAVIDALLAQSVTMQTAVAQALQSELNFLGAVSDLAKTYDVALPAKFADLQSTTRSNLSTANGDLSKLLADKKTLDSAKQAIVNAQQTVTLDQVGNQGGDNPISLQVSANSIAKEEQDIANQQADLADYTVVAPFGGTVSAVNVKRGDSVSGAVATVISDSQVAALSLNEVDAAKVKTGQKATLTFDALDGVTLTGTVAEVDSVGTVSQGVVSYAVKIAFDTQDSRIKPGMTVNASIQTGVAQDVLVVPSSAVKTANGQSYVQAFTPPLADPGGSAGVTAPQAPEMVAVVTGLSDDTNVEITSGLSEGQQIVVSTRSASKTTSAAASSAAAGRAGAGGAGAARSFGGGGAVLRGL